MLVYIFATYTVLEVSKDSYINKNKNKRNKNEKTMREKSYLLSTNSMITIQHMRFYCRLAAFVQPQTSLPTCEVLPETVLLAYTK